jgi:cyclopropane-fatty-acyl-phospholipid synthase
MDESQRESPPLAAARALFRWLGERLGAPVAVRLWDDSLVPLGPDPAPRLELRIAHAGALGSLLRRPTPANLLARHASGQIDFVGGDLLELLDALREKSDGSRPRARELLALAPRLLPLLLARAPRARVAGFPGATAGRRREDRAWIAFHYDLPSAFFAEFLDPEMQYSCAYFTARAHSLERAQRDKLDMVCRKLRLAPGERLLDVGCGWGGLACWAAERYGVRVHGITLSQEQCDFARERVRRRGLDGRVVIECRDYATLDARYDKIASVAMFEHVGVARLPVYFARLHAALADDGILLNHGIANRARRRRGRGASRDTRLVRRYLLPGLELTDPGHAIGEMERAGFEVRDVESWREHYALTARHWVRNLAARRDEAMRLVGAERYRVVVACLAGLALSFERGSNSIFQIVATKRRSAGARTYPLTRQDLYGAGSQARR